MKTALYYGRKIVQHGSTLDNGDRNGGTEEIITLILDTITFPDG